MVAMGTSQGHRQHGEGCRPVLDYRSESVDGRLSGQTYLEVASVGGVGQET